MCKNPKVVQINWFLLKHFFGWEKIKLLAFVPAAHSAHLCALFAKDLDECAAAQRVQVMCTAIRCHNRINIAFIKIYGKKKTTNRDENVNFVSIRFLPKTGFLFGRKRVRVSQKKLFSTLWCTHVIIANWGTNKGWIKNRQKSFFLLLKLLKRPFAFVITISAGHWPKAVCVHTRV